MMVMVLVLMDGDIAGGEMTSDNDGGNNNGHGGDGNSGNDGDIDGGSPMVR